MHSHGISSFGQGTFVSDPILRLRNKLEDAIEASRFRPGEGSHTVGTVLIGPADAGVLVNGKFFSHADAKHAAAFAYQDYLAGESNGQLTTGPKLATD